MMKSTATLAVLLLTLCGAAHAQNLIVNPNFSTNVDGWTADASTSMSWSSMDADNSAQSGSMALAFADQTQAASASQCVAVSGTAYSFGADVLSVNPTNGSVQLYCQAFASGDCSGNELDGVGAESFGTNQAGWQELRTGAPFALPQATASVSCTISVATLTRPTKTAQPAGFPIVLYVDNAFFGLGTTPVTLQSFDVE